MSVALVLVSHSGRLAKGAEEIAAQMAPDVAILPAGGTDDDRIGTSYDRIEAMIAQARGEGHDVLVLADLGSAMMTAEAVLDALEDDRVRLVDVPFVEGTVAAAVAAQGGADLDAVARATGTAVEAFARPAPAAPAAPAVAGADAEAVTRTVSLGNTLGLHARPAAALAAKAAGYDAEVSINGVDAASLLALMGLGLPGGAEVTVSGTGSQAAEAVEAIAADIAAGFGES